MRDTTKQVLLGVLLLVVAPGLLFAQPTSVSYQGRLEKDDSPHDGQADLKFVIVDGGASLWSNDGTSVDGAEPSGFVTIEVAAGLFQVLLGGGGMQPLTADRLAGVARPQLRIWVRAPAGAGSFEQLTDQAISSVPFSLRTEAGGTGESLWETNGTDVYRRNGNVGIGTLTPGYSLSIIGTGIQISGDNAEFRPRGTGSHMPDYDGDTIEERGVFVSSSNDERDSIRFRAGGSGAAGTGGIKWGRYDSNDYFLHRPAGQTDLLLEYIDYEVSPNTKKEIIHFKANGHTSVNVLEITGADLVESFDLTDTECELGTVVVIDRDVPGQLRSSYESYDTRVAGVVSGAGDLPAGIRMGEGSGLGGDIPVAMTGRVYVKCTTANGPIYPGDRLTTSNVPGHAMKATDRQLADGAVLGKAMTALVSGEGLVLALVNLQ